MLNKLFLKKLKKPIDIHQKVWYSIFKEKEETSPRVSGSGRRRDRQQPGQRHGAQVSEFLIINVEGGLRAATEALSRRCLM
jgi:hypothetical protein